MHEAQIDLIDRVIDFVCRRNEIVRDEEAIIISLDEETRKIERELLRQVPPNDAWKGLTTILGGSATSSPR